MGKPAITWFCRNGHIADAADHHYDCDFDMEDSSQKCLVCGIEGDDNFRCITEWDDPDYWDNSDNDTLIPHKPIR